MKRLTAILFALALAGTGLVSAPAHALGDKEKKAIAAALAIGLAVAAAKHGKDHDGSSQWDESLHGQPFRPAAGVVCMPKPRKCYEGGHISWRWTKRVFG
jgi:hypothetical protein